MAKLKRMSQVNRSMTKKRKLRTTTNLEKRWENLRLVLN